MTAPHQPLSRRESLRRAALLAAGSGMPFSFAAASEMDATTWVVPQLPPINAPGYGTDPDLIHPPQAPWPKTLKPRQLELVAALADVLIPAEGALPAASAVGVTDVLDEWVSAPYPDQQAHRSIVIAGLDWCDREAERRFARKFVRLSSDEQQSIVHDIAFPAAVEPDPLATPRQFFDLFRRLITGMYYTSDAGSHELGYQGNVPLAGDYPGPSVEAMAHLSAQAARLGLTL